MGISHLPRLRLVQTRFAAIGINAVRAVGFHGVTLVNVPFGAVPTPSLRFLGELDGSPARLVTLRAEPHPDRLCRLPDAEALDLLAARKDELEAQRKRSADPE